MTEDHPRRDLRFFFTPIIPQRMWLLLILTLGIHLLILGAYIRHHELSIKRSTGSLQAMEKLIIRASQVTNTEELKKILNGIDDAGIDLGYYSLKFNVENIKVQNKNVNDNFYDYYYQLPDRQWLHYIEKPNTNFLDSSFTLVFLEMGMIALVIFYFWTTFRFTKPLMKFKLSADRFATDLSLEPLNEVGPSMIRETADALNNMQKKIHDLVNCRTQMLAKISHDLRTPITRLKLRTQFIVEQVHASEISADLDEMECMITEILSFATHDMIKEKKIKFDIYALLISVCYCFIDRGHNIEILGDAKSTAFLGRTIAMKRTLINLIENALKYAGQARIELIQRDHLIKIIIEDSGPGIPAAEIEKVKLPYYRSNNALSKNVSGTGLGLTIADEIIRNHGGTLTLKNLEKSGLQVTIVLPLGGNDESGESR